MTDRPTRAADAPKPRKTAKTPCRDGLRQRKAGGKYYGIYTDEHGKRRERCTEVTDRAAAKTIRDEWQKEARLRQAGIIDGAEVDRRERASQPNGEHLARYGLTFDSKNRVSYTATRLRKIQTILDFGGMDTPAKIKPEGFWAWNRSAAEAGLNFTTRREYLGALKGYTRWLASPDSGPVLTVDPLGSVRRRSIKFDRHEPRRMILPAEWPWLLAAAGAGPVRNGMTGEERAVLYLVAVETGLRAEELTHVIRGTCRLTEDPPYIVHLARHNKGAKVESRQYLTAATAERLGRLIATKHGNTPVFTPRKGKNLARTLLQDLAEARRLWLGSIADPAERVEQEGTAFLKSVNDEGKKLVFHSLRHTCGSWLVRQGANVKAVQRVMRHSNIRLTLDTYGHLLPGDDADAVASLAILTGPAVVPEAAALTGTGPSEGPSDGSGPTVRLVRPEADDAGTRAAPVPHSPCLDVPADTLACIAAGPTDAGGVNGKALPEAVLRLPKPGGALGCIEVGGERENRSRKVC